MFPSWFLGGESRPPAARRRADRGKKTSGGASFRPRLECLEDRLVPSAATHFLLLGPPVTQVGQAAQFQLVALDASNHAVRNFSGTVKITSSDNSDALPASVAFPTYNNGETSFSVTLAASGSDTLSAADGSITGSIMVQVNPADVATHFLIVPAYNVQAGVPAGVLVEALDASNHVVKGFTDTVQFSTSDKAANIQLPGNYQFQTSDHGVHYFSFTLQTLGSQSLTVTDTNAANPITSSVSVQVNPAPVVTHFMIVAPRNVTVGVPTAIDVTALDASNRPVPNYTGTVQFSNTDTAATGLPATYQFTANDHGTHVFMVTFETAGGQTLEVMDKANNLLLGTVLVQVAAASPFGRHHGFGFFGYF